MIKNNDLQVLKKDRKIGKILGVGINSTSLRSVLALVRDFIARGCKFYIVTPNPEIILKAQKDKNLMSALNRATISISDGVGVAMAYRYLRMKTFKNILLRLPLNFLQGFIVGLSLFFNKKWLFSGLPVIKGREVFIDLISLANKKSWRVFLLGGKGDEALKTAEKLKLSYKKIKLENASGPILDNEAKPVSESDIDIQNDVVDRINNFKPQFLFVAFGAPKQEKWINEWLPKLNIGGAMVVGGTFSYISGTKRIPPKWMGKAGFEWIWRLLTEPKRLTRILNAVFVFPLKIFIYKIRSSN